MRRAFVAAAGILAVATSAVAGPPVGPRAPNIRPTATGDEGGLWSVSDKAEIRAKASAELDKDPALNEYVRAVACKVTTDYCGDIRVYVLDRPVFNAAMAPNGYMEVWSGLLLRVDNEAQLAFVLGHESAHYIHNHSLETWRTAKARSNVGFMASLIFGGVGASIVGDIVYLGAMASLFSYSREKELEADRLGLETAIKAGYDGAQAAEIWRGLLAETGASQFDKVRKAEARNGVFSSHPINADRITAIEAVLKEQPKGGAVEHDRYRAVIRPHLAAWLKDDLRRKDFGSSLQLIERLSRSGEDLGVLGFYKGEAYRLRRGDGDLGLARAAYEAAVAQPDAPAQAWRELGSVLHAAGEADKAKAAYETYLARAPSADDRWLVEASLKTLSGAQS
jgi:tetratricopeptide (TPR) repeat protein